ncbi:RNA methyltransferase [Candidatus Bathyarchaeota archaeon]|nr:MAG: RNA methyltransferase [Candidatus Bathyarchaeota archaeon]
MAAVAPLEFNLLVSTPRGREHDGCSELWYLLAEVGDERAEVETTPIKGLICACTSLDPFEAVRRLRALFDERPEEFRVIQRVIPIERVVRTDLAEIARAAQELALAKIEPDEKFRITVEKRHTELGRMEIIRAVAEGINRSVDLENPDKIVLIEVVGALTGIAIIRPGDILRVQVLRRKG